METISISGIIDYILLNRQYITTKEHEMAILRILMLAEAELDNDPQKDESPKIRIVNDYKDKQGSYIDLNQLAEKSPDTLRQIYSIIKNIESKLHV